MLRSNLGKLTSKIVVHDLNGCRSGVIRPECPRRELRHPRRQITCIAGAIEYPWLGQLSVSNTLRDKRDVNLTYRVSSVAPVTAVERKLSDARKVGEVGHGLLNGEILQILGCQLWEGCRFSPVAICCAIRPCSSRCAYFNSAILTFNGYQSPANGLGVQTRHCRVQKIALKELIGGGLADGGKHNLRLKSQLLVRLWVCASRQGTDWRSWPLPVRRVVPVSLFECTKRRVLVVD